MASFTSSLSPSSDALAIFVNEKHEYKDKKGVLSKSLDRKINSFLEVAKVKKKDDEIISFDISDKQKCFIVKVKSKHETYFPQECGGRFFSHLKKIKNLNKIDLYIDSLDFDKQKLVGFFSEFCLGFNLKSYTFNKYKTKNKEKINKKITFKIITQYKEKLQKEYKYFDAIKEGVFLSRDLVSEPPNVLNPKKYTEEIKKLSKLGLKVEVLNEAKLKKLGMNSLLGVGQGSENETFLVVIKWNGAKNNYGKPLAFVGKGVCFDTGGLDLKPASGMLRMKKDMGGAAHVLGLASMIMSAKLPIKLRVLIGAVENSISGNSYRPLDVLNTRKGITVENVNTDAEGRLVLGDCLTEASREKPDLILDYATLTGASRVAVGTELAAMYCNNDDLSGDFEKHAKIANDPLWRLPLYEPYRRMLDSKVADISSASEGGFGGGITAALFLQEFVGEGIPWAHLDIMAWNTFSRAGRPEGGEAQAMRAAFGLIVERYGS